MEEQRQSTFNDIRSTIYPNAMVASPAMGCMLRIASAGVFVPLFLSAQTRIIELPETDILSNYRYPYSGTLRGVHDWERGKILLCEGNWCRETLIHETLHSVSFPTVRSDLRRRLINFFEGLTEFFAGYVMFRCYPQCYQAWKENVYDVCSVTYVQMVKICGALCRFVSINELAKIYFWDGTRNWESRYDHFLHYVRQLGFPQFGDFVRRAGLPIEVRLEQECIRTFGRRFQDILNDPTQICLDFTQMVF